MNTIHGITAAEFKAAGNPADHYLPTFSGFAKAGHIRQDWWIVCPDENAGFGLSFCCGPDTRLYPLDELLETFGCLAAADGAIVGAGGHMAKALAEVEAQGQEIADAEEREAMPQRGRAVRIARDAGLHRARLIVVGIPTDGSGASARIARYDDSENAEDTRRRWNEDGDAAFLFAAADIYPKPDRSDAAFMAGVASTAANARRLEEDPRYADQGPATE